MKSTFRLLSSLLALLVLAYQIQAQTNVLTYHNDNARTGQMLQENVLSPGNVNVNGFGRQFYYQLDGRVYTQPLYLPGVSIPNKGIHNVIYVATEHDGVYALDADSNSGSNAQPLWYVNFTDAQNGVTTVPSSDFNCPDLTPEIGITGTPAIDSGTDTIYLVARTKETGVYVDRLHALDVTSGAEKFGGPVVITATVPGTGEGGSVVTFNSMLQNQRAALLLQNGTLYIGFGSLCDITPYHGWILAYNGQTLQQVAAWNSTPNAMRGGVWAGGSAPSGDGNDNLFFATGDGGFDLNNAGGMDAGDSVIRLPAPSSGTWALGDYFTPYNQALLAKNNLDLGSGGVLLLPDQPASSPYQHLAVASGKQGTIYLVNRDNLEKFNPANNQQIPQVITGATPGIMGMPAWWNNNLYYSGRNDVVKQFSFDPGNELISAAPVSSSPAAYPYTYGTTPSISANGTTQGILWAAENHSGTAVMHAYDATNLATELYNTTQNATRDGAGGGVRFVVPTILGGKVYLASNFKLGVYGLFMFVPGKLSFPTQLAGTTSASNSITFTNPYPTTLNITSITTTGEFTQPTGTCPISGGMVSPGASCTISVAFAPQGGGAKNGSILVNASGYGSPFSLPLTGTGKSITVSAATLSFGTVSVGQSGAVTNETFTIYGTDQTTFSSVSITTNSAEFSIASNTCTGSFVGPNMCTVGMVFSPQGGGQRTGALTAVDTSGTQTIKLVGSGAAVQVSPSPVNFGKVTVGTTSSPQTLTVKVVGNTAVTFGAISLAGTDPGDYVLQSDGCSGMAVAGGSSCNLVVAFRPTATGSRPANVSIPNNGGPSPLHVNLSGSGQ